MLCWRGEPCLCLRAEPSRASCYTMQHQQHSPAQCLLVLVLSFAPAAMLHHSSQHHHTTHHYHSTLHHDASAGNLEMRIVNGDNVDIVDYPFQVSIEKHARHTCGGAIISPKWVVSARHCFKVEEGKPLRPVDYRIRVGTTYRQYGGSLHPVDRIINHPGPEGFDWDVSLLRVSKPFAYGQTVQPIGLPAAAEAMPPAKKKLVVTGYGAIGENARLASRLLKADLTVVEPKECAEFFMEKAGASITERMICASSLRQDACQGDSGGPLTESVSKLVGVVSFGLGCGHKGFPGVYTNLAEKDIRSFIKLHTGV